MRPAVKRLSSRVGPPTHGVSFPLLGVADLEWKRKAYRAKGLSLRTCTLR